jgi:hypothetical protein
MIGMVNLLFNHLTRQIMTTLSLTVYKPKTAVRDVRHETVDFPGYSFRGGTLSERPSRPKSNVWFRRWEWLTARRPRVLGLPPKGGRMRDRRVLSRSKPATPPAKKRSCDCNLDAHRVPTLCGQFSSVAYHECLGTKLNPPRIWGPLNASQGRTPMNAEQSRLGEARTNKAPWKKWGPYLSERQWGTVREDYSTVGNAWEYFSHD